MRETCHGSGGNQHIRHSHIIPERFQTAAIATNKNRTRHARRCSNNSSNCFLSLRLRGPMGGTSHHGHGGAWKVASACALQCIAAQRSNSGYCLHDSSCWITEAHNLIITCGISSRGGYRKRFTVAATNLWARWQESATQESRGA